MTDIDPTAIPIEFDPTRQRMRGVAVHGNASFDVPYISEILPGFFQGGCTFGLTLPDNIKHWISLYPWETYDVDHQFDSRLEVRMFDDTTTPDRKQVVRLAEWVNACRAQGSTLVSCQAGLNRSGLIAGLALVLEGRKPAEAIALLRTSRSPAVLCNPTFERWLMEYA